MGKIRVLAAQGRDRRAGEGSARLWLGLIATIAAETYLVLLLTLTVIAVLPLVSGWHASVVQSGSMRPHIDAGDVVVLAPWAPDETVPMGGVVQFRSPAEAEPDHTERLRLHRIVDANDDGTLVTAGDANAEVDSTPLNRQQITGQARLLVPYIGLPTHWAQTGQWTPLTLWAAGTLAALALAYAGLRHRAHRPSAGGGASSGNSAAEAPPNEASQDAGVDRRHVLLGAGLLLALPSAAMLHRIPPVGATFTARTATTGNTWTVAKALPLSLGRAASYLLMARTSIANTDLRANRSTVGGSIATSPGTSITGFSTRAVSGNTHRNTGTAPQARQDALTLYTRLGEQQATRPVSDLDRRITPGVYRHSGSLTVTGTVTLDARGNPDSLFIFQLHRLTTGEGCKLVLTGGAKSSNIFIRLTDELEIGTDNSLHGIFLARDNVTMRRFSTLHGHLFAINGSINLTASTITSPHVR